MPLLVVRHADAGSRSAFTGDDRLRPLSSRGHDRAVALVPLLSPYRPQSILSSPSARCRETVQPIAEASALSVESVDALAEGQGADAVRLLRTLSGESAVLCTHGDVAAEILVSLVPEADATGRSDLKLQKGEFWVIQPAGASLAVVEHIRR